MACTSRYYMNPAGCERFPASTLTMPFLNMFKSRRARATSLPRHSERYMYDSGANDQSSAYGSRPSSGYGRSHNAPPQAGSRAQQRYPPYGPSLSDSSAERYSEAPTDESWYRVEDSDYRHGPHGRGTAGYYAHPEGGRNRYSDVSGAAGVPVHATSETSSWAASPVPAVHRDGVPSMGSRMFEQFGVPPPPIVHPPASVTRVDLHEDPREAFDDRRRRGAPVHPAGAMYPYPTSQNRQAFAPAPQRRHSNRRQSQQHAYQGPIHVTLPSDSSRSDVMQKLENGDRVPIPRHPVELRLSGPGSYGQVSNTERTYYIVPPGMNVIFRDEYGNELKRVGDFSDTYNPDMYDETPVQLTDERGHIVYKTGENYTDDGSDVSEATYRPKVVHLGQYVSHGSAIPRASSPLAVSLDGRGHHRNIQLEHSDDGSFGGSQGSDRTFSPHLSHTRSEGNLLRPTAGFGSGNRGSSPDHVRLRTIYP